MPRGSRPSIAALTRSGARKASEIVMLTLRLLHPSRTAMPSTLTVGFAISSSSHCRPRSTRPRWRGSPTGSHERVAAASPQAKGSHDAALRVFYAKAL
jgi:hypothetical protein